MSQRPAMARAGRPLGRRPSCGWCCCWPAAAAAVWSVIDPSRAVWVAVSVLIVTCPCALSLAAPAALVAAAGGLARRGVLVQRLDALESWPGCDHLFIDKTGTLTDAGAAAAAGARARRPNRGAGHAATRRWRVAASLAAWSRHPLSRGAGRSRRRRRAPWAWSQVEEVAGPGPARRAMPQGMAWRLGSRDWAWRRRAARRRCRRGAQVWLCADGRRLRQLRASTRRLREGAAEAVAALRAMGYRLSLLSGDSPARAQRLAAAAGRRRRHRRRHARRASWPSVAAAQARGERVAMVGDGVNDAPVLARADVSLAMGQGALVARAQADAVLVGNRPMDVVRTLRVARRTHAHRASESCLGRLYNAACVPLALVGWLPPWAAGLGMAAQFAGRGPQRAARGALS